MTAFLSKLVRVVNTGQARAVVLTGNIYDLFYDGKGWVPLLSVLRSKCALARSGGQKGIAQMVWPVNRPIEISCADGEELGRLWAATHNRDRSLDDCLAETGGNSVYGLELLRQLTEVNRRHGTDYNLVALVEGADMLLPDDEVSRMAAADRKRVSVVQDWFCDPDFINGHDTVVLVAESRSALHRRIARLPHVLSIEVPLPDVERRKEFIAWHAANNAVTNAQQLADTTSGLSLHAVLQLLRSGDLSADNVAAKVEEYMESELGEGVVEFKRPTHRLDDVIGFTRLKEFFRKELIPGFRKSSKSGISGALVVGPIGGGKTFTCEAVAAEVGCPVIVLKNVRSKWYGETDQIFEKLRRLLESFHKVMIFVDEADTMFGGVDSDQDVERRLTGKIQAMMSDPELRGRVVWFLMTARVHRLSPDIRRPGRMDVIIPVLDPEGDDLREFRSWAVGHKISGECLERFTKGFSPAAFALVRSWCVSQGEFSEDALYDFLGDLVEPDIGDTRRYQSLQAMLNCTRRSLLVDEDVKRPDFEVMRGQWREEVRQLEAKGQR